MQTATEKARTTDLESILERLSSQNSRFIGNLQHLENIGHKLRDTRTPDKNEQGGVAPDTGLIQNINTHLDYYSGHNSLLENLISKLTDLI